MPLIQRLALYAADKRPPLEAVALGDSELTLEQMAATAERFDLGACGALLADA